MVVEFVTNGIVSGFRRQSLRKPQEVAVGENEENGWVAGGQCWWGSQQDTPSTFQQNRRREKFIVPSVTE